MQCGPWHCAGPRWTRGDGIQRGSSGHGSPALQSPGAHRRWGKRRRALRWSLLAAQTGGRGVETGRRWSGASVIGRYEHGEVELGVGWGVVENGRGGGAFFRVGEVAKGRGGGRSMRWVLISSVSTLNRGGKSTRRRASAGEWRRSGDASVQLHSSVGGRSSAACDVAARPDGRRRLGRPEEGEKAPGGLVLGWNGPRWPGCSWVGLVKTKENGVGSSKDFGPNWQWVAELISELISRI
jgi:hypothetical protein